MKVWEYKIIWECVHYIMLPFIYFLGLIGGLFVIIGFIPIIIATTIESKINDMRYREEEFGISTGIPDIRGDKNFWQKYPSSRDADFINLSK